MVVVVVLVVVVVVFLFRGMDWTTDDFVDASVEEG